MSESAVSKIIDKESSEESITRLIREDIDTILKSEHAFTYDRTMRITKDETMQCQETGCYIKITIETETRGGKNCIDSVWYVSATHEPSGMVYRIATGFENDFVGVRAVDEDKKSLVVVYLGALDNDEHLHLYDKDHNLHVGVVDHPDQLEGFHRQLNKYTTIDYDNILPMTAEYATRILKLLGAVVVKREVE